jgi:hypothetical protein
MPRDMRSRVACRQEALWLRNAESHHVSIFTMTSYLFSRQKINTKKRCTRWGQGRRARGHGGRLQRQRHALQRLCLPQLPLLKRHTLRPVERTNGFEAGELDVGGLRAVEHVRHDPVDSACHVFIVGGREFLSKRFENGAQHAVGGGAADLGCGRGVRASLLEGLGGRLLNVCSVVAVEAQARKWIGT